MIKSFRALCIVAIGCCSSIFAAHSYAQGFQPTPQQIEQFKSLSPQQQRQLAQSMGIDIDALIQQQTGGSAPVTESETPSELRGRQQSTQQAQVGSGQERLLLGGPVSLEDVVALQEMYRDLSVEEFDEYYEREFGHLSRRAFLTVYEQVTGRTFEADKTLKPFGYDLFAIGPDAFAPPSDSPVPADYVMGPGDTLVVQLYGKENSTYNLTISRDGDVRFPNIGPINLAGLTFSQAQNLIANTVSEQMIGVKSSVTMGSLRTIRVFVLGEALQPGSYTVSSLSTMTNALFISGGTTEVGSLRNIQLKRSGKVVTTLDVYDLLLQGDTSRDSRLMPGDVIFIPPVGNTVAVTGEVKRPAIYELKDESTAAEVVALAGGTTSQAYLELTRLKRLNDEGEQSLIPLNLGTDSGRSFTVRNADRLEVSSVLDEVNNAITLEGHVKRPGTYAWRSNFHFSELVRSVDQLQSNPDLEVALIKRQDKQSKQTEIRIFSPREAWANRGSTHDPILQERDTIYLFDFETDRTEALEEIMKDLQIQSRYQEREKTVSVVGSVRFPGSYPLAEGMTTHELINLAGGLTESALGTDAEITRYDVDESLERVVVHIPIDLRLEETNLQAADILRVKQIPLWKEKETVQLTGEVMHPGTYSITPGETMTEVINRAGGLTKHAYPRGAVFSRADLRQLERERLLDLRDKLEAEIAASSLTEDAASTSISPQEAQQLVSNLENVEAVGRMVIDLPQILKAPLAYDFQMQNGDTLEIPRYKPSVTVVGEVQYPTSHFFDHALNVEDYIDRSGGTKLNADEKRIYIVKASGQVVLPETSAWFRRSSVRIEPGDTIIVPVDTNRVDRLTLWSSVTQIMYQAALGIAAISSL